MNDTDIYQRLRENLEERYEYWGSNITDSDVSDLAEYDLDTFISEANSFKLYRYMPANYFNIRNIETQTIHLSPNGMMNDVFEGLPKTSVDFSYDLSHELNDLVFMACMTETNNNILMWSHYAQNNEGFCVEYDLKKLADNNSHIIHHVFPVVYSNKRLPQRDIDSLIENHKVLNRAITNGVEYDGAEKLDNILPLFLVKSKAWKYEKEWRIVCTKKQMYDIDSKELYSGNIKFECISAVYLGYRIHPEIEKNILEICERFDSRFQPISVYKAKLANDKYEIIFEQLR